MGDVNRGFIEKFTLESSSRSGVFFVLKQIVMPSLVNFWKQNKIKFNTVNILIPNTSDIAIQYTSESHRAVVAERSKRTMFTQVLDNSNRYTRVRTRRKPVSLRWPVQICTRVRGLNGCNLKIWLHHQTANTSTRIRIRSGFESRRLPLRERCP
jgi:hypothetical protein